jgi:hypothetical protein
MELHGADEVARTDAPLAVDAAPADALVESRLGLAGKRFELLALPTRKLRGNSTSTYPGILGEPMTWSPMR